MIYSPLRYPGGKNRLADFISKALPKADINLIEPYAGGAGVALKLLIEGRVNAITLNDIDRSIFSFWHSVLFCADELCVKIENTKIDLENWKGQKSIQKNKKSAALLELGFSTLFLNRTNVSGVLAGGVIGGKSQNGKYRINARFNKAAIIERIERIAKFRNKIAIDNCDALDFIRRFDESPAVFYCDPPYYNKASGLYSHYYDDEAHQQLAATLKKTRCHWLLSYDNAPEILKIYSWLPPASRHEIFLNHSAGKTRRVKELFFTRPRA